MLYLFLCLFCLVLYIGPLCLKICVTFAHNTYAEAVYVLFKFLFYYTTS